jgi:glycosyltransferase involved in cell wall biosynthesis
MGEPFVTNRTGQEAHVLWALPDGDHCGGVTLRTLMLLPFLQALQVRGDLWMPEGPLASDPAFPSKLPANVSLLVGCGPGRVRHWRSFLHNVTWVWTLPFSLWRLTRQVRRSRYDVIHVNGVLNWVPLLVAWWTGTPVVWMLVGNHYPESWAKRIVQIWKKRVDALVVLAPELASYYGLSLSEVTLMFEPVRLPAPSTQGRSERRKAFLQANRLPGSWLDAPWIVGLGHWTPAKDWETWLQVAGESYPTPVYFFLMGDETPTQSAYAERLRTLLRGENLALVTHLGFREDAVDLLGLFDVLLLTSVQEGTPLVILEAQAQGVAVVATDTGGVGYLLTHGTSGWLSPVKAVDVLVEGVRQMTQRSALRETLVPNARSQCLARHHPKEVARRWRDLYHDLVQRARSSSDDRRT